MYSLGKPHSELVSIPDSNVCRILPILLCRKPKSSQFYNVTKLCVDKRFSSKIEAKFYSSSDESKLQNDTFLLVAISFLYFPEVIIMLSSPKEEISDEMIARIENTLDWTIPHTFGNIFPSQVARINELCERNGNPVNSNEHINYYLEMDDVKLLPEILIPPSIQIKQIRIDDVKKVDERWGLAAPGSALQMVQDAIETIGSTGMYNDAEELMSWVFISTVGSFNALHTEEKYRRKGYSELVLRSMIKFAAETLEIFSVCHVATVNIPSQKLMEKVGFKKVDHSVYWLDYKLRK